MPRPERPSNMSTAPTMSSTTPMVHRIGMASTMPRSSKINPRTIMLCPVPAAGSHQTCLSTKFSDRAGQAVACGPGSADRAVHAVQNHRAWPRFDGIGARTDERARMGLQPHTPCGVDTSPSG